MQDEAAQSMRVRSIASLKRGLDVLSLVHAGEGLLLRDLHAATGLPKASLLRILKTLMAHQSVRRREADGAYLGTGAQATRIQPPASPLGAVSSVASIDLSVSTSVLADAAARVLVDLKQALAWPSDVAVPHGETMRVIDSNRADYGRAWHPSVIGEVLDMRDSAMGRAYLAFSPLDVRQLLIEVLLAHGGSQARRREALERELQATRQRGFAARDHLYAGPDTHHGRQLSSVAVPVMVENRVVACVSCVWNTRTTSRAEVIELSLAHLVRGACRLGAILRNPS